MKLSKINQRGITLIEILLVAVIVAASVVGVFMFSQKASVTAAVETEQAQVDRVVQTVESLFATQADFSALGSNGAAYLQDNARQAGLRFGTDATGQPSLITELGGGKGTVELISTEVQFTSGAPSFPNNGFALVYNGLEPAECINLITATAARATRVDIGQPGQNQVLVAEQGSIVSDRSQISTACSTNSGATVQLSFANSRGVSVSSPGPGPGTTTPSTCSPVRETQITSCPPGQSGSISQERFGNCSGPGNSLVYTAWTTYEDTCNDDAVVPPDEDPDPDVIDDLCSSDNVVQYRSTACPVGEIGQIVERRTVNECDSTSGDWELVSNSCFEDNYVTGTPCAPDTEERTIGCPSGQGGQIVQTRSSTCGGSPPAPVWGSWTELSNNCTSSCVANGTCCTVQRETQTIMEPCPAGTYGDSGREEERFLGCVSATTQSSSWTPWQVVEASSTCTACPADTQETQTRWQDRTTSCPAGQTGSIEMEAQQTRTRTTSYNCPSGTTSLPSPTVGSWSSWSDTGTTRNVVNNCVTSTVCVAGSMSGMAGWSFNESVIDNGIQYDRNDYSIASNVLPASCGVASGETGTWSYTDVPRPWQPKCDCTAALNGVGYDYRWGENWGLESLGRATCHFPAPQNILVFEVQSMEESGSGATAVISVTTDLGVSTTDTFSCSSFTGTGAVRRCASRTYETSVGTQTLVFGKRSGGQPALFNDSNQDVNITSGSYASCLAPVASSCSVAAGTTFNWTVGGNSCSFTQSSNTSVSPGSNFTAVDSTAPTTGTANFACTPPSHTVDPSTYTSGQDTNCDAPARWPDTTQDDAVNRFCATAPAGSSGTVSWCPSPQVEASIHVVCGGSAPVLKTTPRPGATCATSSAPSCPGPSGIFPEYSNEGDWHAPGTPGMPWFNPNLKDPTILATQFTRGTRCNSANIGRFLSVGQGGYAGEWYSWLFVCRASGFELVAEGEIPGSISWASGFSNVAPYSTAVANAHQGAGWSEPQVWKTAYGPVWYADWVCGVTE